MDGWCAWMNFSLLREAFPNVPENFFTAIVFLKENNNQKRRMFAFVRLAKL